MRRDRRERFDYSDRRKFKISCFCCCFSALNCCDHLCASLPLLECAWIACSRSGGSAVVQEEQPLSDAPQRRSAELIRPGGALRDPVRQARVPCDAPRNRNTDGRSVAHAR